MKIAKAIPVITMILAGYFCVEIGELIGYATELAAGLLEKIFMI